MWALTFLKSPSEQVGFWQRLRAPTKDLAHPSSGKRTKSVRRREKTPSLIRQHLRSRDVGEKSSRIRNLVSRETSSNMYTAVGLLAIPNDSVNEGFPVALRVRSSTSRPEVYCTCCSPRHSNPHGRGCSGREHLSSQHGDPHSSSAAFLQVRFRTYANGGCLIGPSARL